MLWHLHRGIQHTTVSTEQGYVHVLQKWGTPLQGRRRVKCTLDGWISTKQLTQQGKASNVHSSCSRCDKA